MFSCRLTLIASAPAELIPMVYPSGSALATALVPTAPPAPPRLSMTTVWPRSNPSFRRLHGRWCRPVHSGWKRHDQLDRPVSDSPVPMRRWPWQQAMSPQRRISAVLACEVLSVPAVARCCAIRYCPLHEQRATTRRRLLRLQGRAGGRAAGADQRHLLGRRRALRPDERPDVGRAAPAVEGRPDRLDGAAEVGAGVPSARRGRRHRRYHRALSARGRQRLHGRAVRHQPRDGGGGPQAADRCRSRPIA